MTLTEQYKSETGKDAYQYGGVPEREYVEWLEQNIEADRNFIKDIYKKWYSIHGRHVHSNKLLGAILQVRIKQSEWKK